MQQNHNRTIVFSRWLANALVHEGFQIVKIEICENDPSRFVYLFETTPNFEMAFFRLQSEKRKKQ